MGYKYIEEIVDIITNDYPEFQYIGYSEKEILFLEKTLPYGKKIPGAIKEWLLFAGNNSPAFMDRASFSRMSAIRDLSNDFYNGKFNENIKKIREKFFFFCPEDGTEDYFEYIIFPYNENENPTTFIWTQYFEGENRVLTDQEYFEEDDAKTFLDLVQFFME